LCQAALLSLPAGTAVLQADPQVAPDSVDCLKFLERLCSDFGLQDVQEYSLKLKKAKKFREAKRPINCPLL